MVVGVVPLLIVGFYLLRRKGSASDDVSVEKRVEMGYSRLANQNEVTRFSKLRALASERTKDGKDKKKRKLKVFDLITEIEQGAKNMRKLTDNKKNSEADKLLLTLKNKFNRIKEEERNQLNGILKQVKSKKDEYSDFKELEEEWHKFVNERVFWHSGKPFDGNGPNEVINLFEQLRTPKLRDPDVFKVKK